MHVQSCPTLHDPVDCSPPGSSVHGLFSGENTGAVFPPLGDLPNPGIEPKSVSPALAGGFFTTCTTWENKK